MGASRKVHPNDDHEREPCSPNLWCRTLVFTLPVCFVTGLVLNIVGSSNLYETCMQRYQPWSCDDWDVAVGSHLYLHGCPLEATDIMSPFDDRAEPVRSLLSVRHAQQCYQKKKKRKDPFVFGRMRTTVVSPCDTGGCNASGWTLNGPFRDWINNELPLSSWRVYYKNEFECEPRRDGEMREVRQAWSSTASFSALVTVAEQAEGTTPRITRGGLPEDGSTSLGTRTQESLCSGWTPTESTSERDMYYAGSTLMIIAGVIAFMLLVLCCCGCCSEMRCLP